MYNINLITILNSIDDPRIDRRKLHKLTDILFIAICSSICGMCGWEEFESFGEEKIDLFRKFIPLENGIPSHDTFRRVFERIDPKQLQNALTEMVKLFDIAIEGKVVAIDGKTLKGAFDSSKNISAIHTISAWASESRMVLGTCDVDKKENEITAIPKLLEILEIRGAIVTMDAMGCQKDIAKKIVKENKADYIFTLKKNHPVFYDDVEKLFSSDLNKLGIQSDIWEKTERGHGRLETRICESISSSALPVYIKDWEGLKSISKITSYREEKGRTSKDIRYFISTLPNNAQKIACAVREHWQMENVLHWSLDVVYHEDSIHICRDNSAKNLSVIRRIGFSLAKLRTPKGMTTKRAQLRSVLSQKFAIENLIQF